MMINFRKHLHKIAHIFIPILFIALLLNSCHSTAVKQNPQHFQLSALEYFESHSYQEAAWQYINEGDSAGARNSIAKIEEIFNTNFIEINSLGTNINLSETYLLTFEQDVKGVFKVEGSDTVGSIFYDLAVYHLDQLLGFNFTPYTTIKTYKLPDGRITRGSLMYFVKGCQSALAVNAKRTDKMHFFDAIIGNIDRHTNNWLIRSNGEEVMIDHDRTFLYDHTGWVHTNWQQEVTRIKHPSELGTVYQRYKEYPQQAFQHAVEDLIGYNRFDLFLNVREQIIEEIEEKSSNQ